jgi:hypothetical protein
MSAQTKCLLSLPKFFILIDTAKGVAMLDAFPITKQLQDAYTLARERYAMLGVDTDQAIARLVGVSLSLHCWQGDDVAGFESPGDQLGGGIAATRRPIRGVQAS